MSALLLGMLFFDCEPDNVITIDPFPFRPPSADIVRRFSSCQIVNRHANYAANESDQNDEAENRRQGERKCGNSSAQLSSGMKGVHEIDRSGKKNNPRTEELKWVSSAKASTDPKSDGDEGLKRKCYPGRHRCPTTQRCQRDADCGKHERKQIVVQIVIHRAHAKTGSVPYIRIFRNLEPKSANMRD